MAGDAPEYGEGRLISGRYRLLCVLGSGGTGRVWLAYDEELACLVSLQESARPAVPIGAGEPVAGVSAAAAGPRAWGAMARARSGARDAARRRGQPYVAMVHEGTAAEAADGAAALGTAVETRPDVLVSDVRMPGPDNCELPGGPASDASSVRVIVVTAVDVGEYAHVVFHVGAYGFLLHRPYVVLLLRTARSARAAGSARTARAAGSARSARAAGSARTARAAGSARTARAAGSARSAQSARSATNGDNPSGPETTTRLLPKRLDQDGPAVSAPGVELTPREQQVAGLVAEGLTNPDIGAALFISQGTVKTHLANLQRKLKVRNRVGIAAWAWQSGLREPSRAVK